MTVEQLLIELWTCPSDAQVVFVQRDGTEECHIQDFEVKHSKERDPEDDKVLLIEKSSDSKKHEIFEFASTHREGLVAVFQDCNLNQQVGFHKKGTYFPIITINVETNGMSLFDDCGILVNYYTLKKTWELV